MLIPCEPLPLFLLFKLSRIYGLDHSEINTSFYTPLVQCQKNNLTAWISRNKKLSRQHHLPNPPWNIHRRTSLNTESREQWGGKRRQLTNNTFQHFKTNWAYPSNWMNLNKCDYLPNPVCVCDECTWVCVCVCVCVLACVCVWGRVYKTAHVYT